MTEGQKVKNCSGEIVRKGYAGFGATYDFRLPLEEVIPKLALENMFSREGRFFKPPANRAKRKRGMEGQKREEKFETHQIQREFGPLN